MQPYIKYVHRVIIFSCLSLPILTQAAEQTKDQNHDQKRDDACVQEFASESYVDKTQAHTFTGLCKTVKWLDGLFGKKRQFDDHEFGGKIELGFKYRERDEFDPKLRIRIKTKLPNASSRASAFIGRVNEDEFVADGNQNPGALAETAIRRRNEDEAEWLVGFGYANPKNKKKGFDYSIGAKISSGLNPFAKIRYRYNFKMPEDHLLRATQTLFWKRDDRFGTTTNLNYTYLLSDQDILELGTSVEFNEDEDQFLWVAGTNWYHRLKSGHALVSRAYVRGEEENSESIPEYGASLTYKRPFLRKWVFLEALLEHRWIKDYQGEPREKSIGVGLQIEMEFGETARRRLN